MGLSMLIAKGKSCKRVDLPVEETVKEVIVPENPLGLPTRGQLCRLTPCFGGGRVLIYR